MMCNIVLRDIMTDEEAPRDFPQCCDQDMYPLVDNTGEDENGDPIYELIYWECLKCGRKE
jgi:hypothetical protein